MATRLSSRQSRTWILAGLALALVLVVLACALPPFAQPQGYHDFADKRAWLGIPNAGDVLSNLAFLIIGLAGLMVMHSPSVRAMPAGARHAYGLMYIGLVLTAFGSGYYHWAPSDARLVWDRLPMTVVFMPLLAATLAERLRWRHDGSLIVLTLLGIGSVVYWQMSGNLLPYLIAQGGAILLILLALAMLPTPWTQRRLLLPAFLSYAIAFVCEKLDPQVFRLTGGTISGHTIKHVAAAATFYFILRMLQKQRPGTEASS